VGLVEQLLASQSHLVLVHLDGLDSHGVFHPAAVGPEQGDDLSDPLVRSYVFENA